MLQKNLLEKKTDISSCEINIGSCSGVNMCHKLGHIDFWDTTFAFVLRHDIVSAFIPARTKYELKTRGLSDMAAGRRDSHCVRQMWRVEQRTVKTCHFPYTRECKLLGLLTSRLKTKD
jgi:hypothetical protein